MRVNDVPMAHLAKAELLTHCVRKRFNRCVVKLKQSPTVQSDDVVGMLFAREFKHFLAPFIHQRFMKDFRLH